MRPALALLLLAVLAGCKEKSDEDRIGEILDQTIAAANAREPGGVVEHASEAFVGPRRADKKECRRILVGYFLRSGWVRVFEQDRKITVTGDEATVMLDVVVAVGKEIEKLEDLIPTNGTRMVFDVKLSKLDGEWKYTAASYSRKTL